MRPNNFDLLRLFAALQVVYCHGCWHLGIHGGVATPWLSQVINWFPGVPIFFTISGFLISRSWERSSDWKTYASNRLVRIYPALWAALLVCIALTASLGFITTSVLASPTFYAWVGAQATLVQFFNPSFLRGFGVGTLNGSLWTIPVELGFYMLLPLIYVCLVNRVSRAIANVDLSILALVSFAYWYHLYHDADGTSTLVKLQLLSPLPHLHMFVIGVLIQRNFESLRRHLEGRAWWWLTAFSTAMLIFQPWAENAIGDAPVAVLGCRILLSLTVISFAFSWRSLSERLLRGNDISYGVYLYHMPVVNVLVHFGWKGSQWHLAATFLATVVMAALSWRLVERPALSLKLRSEVPKGETPPAPAVAEQRRAA